MLGSTPITAVLGAGVDNRDHAAVRSFVRAAADAGLSLMFIYPDSKLPADMRTPRKRSADDKAAREAARDAGRKDWATVRSPAGLALATNDKATLDRYLENYVQQFSTWIDADGAEVSWTKKAADAGTIVMRDPVAVNLAVEVGGSRLVVVDCDTPEQMARWYEVAEIDDSVPPTVVTPGQRDPATGEMAHRDGGHFYFTVPDGVEMPTNLGAMTWGGEHGFAVLWDRRYVLIPPSTRPEGEYEIVGRDYPLPAWLHGDIVKAGQLRLERADRAANGPEDEELATAIDRWADTVSWASILEPMGWTPAPRSDNCGCDVWTAPGVHASPKSATAHDTGCTAGRYTATNAPLHIWTDHDAPPFTDHMDEDGWTPTFSKLQAVALIEFGGNVGKTMDALGVLPDLSAEEGLDPHGPTADLPRITDGGDFDAEIDPSERAIRDRQEETEGLTSPEDAEPDYSGEIDGLAVDMGDAAPSASPYADDVDEPDPDVFDSVHNGVPRIAPFSHWRDMPPPEYVIDGLIEHGGLSCIIGAPGMGKSSVALDMACHIATGKRWQGRSTLKTKVLYLPGEGLAGAVQRIRAWEHAHQISLGGDMLLGNGIILVRAQNEAWGDIATYLARQQVGLVIFDTFARMASGLDENSASEVGNAVRRFDKLRELTNAGILVVHHTAKHSPDVARGSSALNGALDSELLVRPATWDTTQLADADGRMPGKCIEVWTSKQKNSEQLDEAIPLLMKRYDEAGIKAPLITGPNGDVDPMQGEVVLARPLPEPLVETAIRIRAFVDRLPQQGATRGELVIGVRPDPYTLSRADATAYWKQRIGEAVDRALRYQLVETLTGTPSGSRYIPSVNTPDQARVLAAAEVRDDD